VDRPGNARLSVIIFTGRFRAIPRNTEHCGAPSNTEHYRALPSTTEQDQRCRALHYRALPSATEHYHHYRALPKHYRAISTRPRKIAGDAPDCRADYRALPSTTEHYRAITERLPSITEHYRALPSITICVHWRPHVAPTHVQQSLTVPRVDCV